MDGCTYTAKFPLRRDAVGAIRHRVHEVLVDWKLAQLSEDAQLVVSELAGNAVRHARGIGEFCELSLRCGEGVLVVEVADSYQWRMPEARDPGPDEECGRGLLIVEALAHRWGVRPRDPGKTVWAHLCVEAVGE